MENASQSIKESEPSINQESGPWEKMSQEVLSKSEPNHETVEENYYEKKTEFDDDEFKKFRDEIFNASSEDARKIAESRIRLLEEKADKTDEISPGYFHQHIHRGYISGDTTVSFGDAVGGQYKLKDTEYLYDAVEYMRRVVRDYPDANISCTGHSLGGGLGIIAANAYHKKAVVFDAAPSLTTGYYCMWRYMLRT